jgi:hypothetical protein
MRARATPRLTFGASHGNPSPVTVKTTVMRFDSRWNFAGQARYPFIRGAFFYGQGRWETSVCRFREVPRSVNPALPGRQNDSCWSGSSKGTSTMSIYASGATPLRACDPDTEIHYALSEETELGLRTICTALIGLSQLADTPTDELGPYVEAIHLSALFRVLADHGANLLNTAVTRIPAQPDDEAFPRHAQGGLQ